jgi:predicted nucleic acid-binding protein
MVSRVCIDVSMALSWLFPTTRESAVEALLVEWDKDGVELIAPPSFHAEAVSFVRNQVYRKVLLPQQGETAVSLLFEMAVRTQEPADLQRLAFRIATEHDLPRTMDLQYLALAEIEECDLWTASRRLHSRVREWAPRVKLAGHKEGEMLPKKIKPVTHDSPGLWQRI